MASASKLPIDLIPTPGFCIKSTVVNPATLPLSARPVGDNVLEPVHPVIVPAGRKVFINICYDSNVPPPPPADKQTIKRAMNVQEHDDGTYYVPVVVSQPRLDHDKAGNPSLVFDCIFNANLRSRTLRDSEFKVFIVELALQRIEAQTSLILSRQIGTPNITAKGKLEPRRVWVPAWLATGNYASGVLESNAGKGKQLIQEIEPAESEDVRHGADSVPVLPKPRGILKKGGVNKSIGTGTEVTNDAIVADRGIVSLITQNPQVPMWNWRAEGDGRLVVIVDVPKETPYDTIRNAVLDIEPRRLVLRVPGSAYSSPLEIDVDLSKSDAELVANVPGAITAATFHGRGENDEMREPDRTLLLKRQRDFDVDMASAEWRVAEGRLIIRV